MKDTQLRGILLTHYYEHRRVSAYLPASDDLTPPIPRDDIIAVSAQLGEHGLITWHGHRNFTGSGPYYDSGLGRITALGIDVVEGEATSDIKVEFVQNNVTITGSSGVIVGDNNSQTITHHIIELAKAIETSQAPAAQKEEAKGLLRALAGHPLVTSIAGGMVGGLFS